MNRLLICTDLDRTLIPNGAQPESAMARQRFAQLVDTPGVVLVYVSGRDRKLVEQAISHFCLPLPDYVIGDVGTTIYHVGERQLWDKQAEWEKQIATDWHGKNHAAVKHELRDFAELRAQEFHKQNQFKLSYYVQLNEDTHALGVKIRHTLDAADIKARLIWSVDEPAGIGLLDILPASASKLHAIEALMELLAFGQNNTVFCGDSGNDLEVLVSPIQAVLVANAQAEVKNQANSLSRDYGSTDQLYIAQGGFAGMNGNYSAGMLEGIAHYFPETVAWMGMENQE